jgi:chaperonin cofactor prefoldin
VRVCDCAGAAVDVEHTHYAEVEASLEFLQERLEAAERAGAGEEERYQHTTAELHDQLEQQASELVECQHRWACFGC